MIDALPFQIWEVTILSILTLSATFIFGQAANASASGPPAVLYLLLSH